MFDSGFFLFVSFCLVWLIIFFLKFIFEPGEPRQDLGLLPRAARLGAGGLGRGDHSSPASRLSRSVGLSPGEKPGEEPVGDSPKAENESQPLHGSGICKWFNVRMGFGFLSMTAKGGATLDSPVDVFVHQVRGRILRGALGRKGGAALSVPLGGRDMGWGSPRLPHPSPASSRGSRDPPGSFPVGAGGEGQPRAPLRGPAL